MRGVGVSAVDAGDARELELDMHVSEGRELELKLDIGDVLEPESDRTPNSA